MCVNFLHPQGRHVKTGQLAAIKIMEVTEVSAGNGVQSGLIRSLVSHLFTEVTRLKVCVWEMFPTPLHTGAALPRCLLNFDPYGKSKIITHCKLGH